MCLLRDRHSQKFIARYTGEQNIGDRDIQIITPAARLVMAIRRGFLHSLKI